MQTIYTTERLDLQVLQPSYAPFVLEFYQNNKDFLEPVEPKRPPNFYTLDFQEKNLSCEYNAFFKFNHLRLWIFQKSNPKQVIGSICFSNFRKGSFGSCMLGYKLGEEFCGKGYMTEALTMLLPVIQREYNLHRIEAMVLPENESSILLLERLHFQKEGYLHEFACINGTWRDHLLYSYLPKKS